MPANQEYDVAEEVRKLLLKGVLITVFDTENKCFDFRFRVESNDSGGVFCSAVVSPKKNNINLDDALNGIQPAFHRHDGKVYIGMADEGENNVSGLYLMRMSQSVCNQSAYFQQYASQIGFIQCKNLKGFLNILFYNPQINLSILNYTPFSLRRYLDEKIKNKENPHAKKIKTIMLDLINTLNNLHSTEKMICGALTLDSVVFSEVSWVITDLSLTKKIGSVGPAELSCVTEYTCPAAYCKTQQYAASPSVDVYALGVILEKLLLNHNLDYDRIHTDAYAIKRLKREEYEHQKKNINFQRQLPVYFFSRLDFSDIQTFIRLNNNKSRTALKLDRILREKKISEKLQGQIVLFQMDELDILKKFLKSENSELYEKLVNILELNRLLILAYSMKDPIPEKRPTLNQVRNTIHSFGLLRSLFSRISESIASFFPQENSKVKQILSIPNPLVPCDLVFSSSKSDSESEPEDFQSRTSAEEAVRSPGSVELNFHDPVSPKENNAGFFSQKRRISDESSLSGGMSLETSINHTTSFP